MPKPCSRSKAFSEPPAQHYAHSSVMFAHSPTFPLFPLPACVLLCTALTLTTFGQPAGQTTTVAQIGSNRVTITVTGGERLVEANGLPDHAPGAFPNRGNPNTIAAQNYHFHIPIEPKPAPEPRPARGAWFGVALNGVPFEPGTAEFWNGMRQWNYEAKSGFINLGLDAHNAHVQPTGAYHYHGLPTGLIERLGGDGKKMLLVGYAADGFPIYSSWGFTIANDAKSPLKKMRASYRLKVGERPAGPQGRYDGKFTADYEYVKGSGDLDQCNGRFGSTPEYPTGIYHYYITEEFPWISRYWRGAPDRSFNKHGPGPGPGPGGPQDPAFTGPRG